MTQIRDQFSAVGKAQFEAQLDFFQFFSTQALESASRLATLQLAASREAATRALGAGFALAQGRALSSAGVQPADTAVAPAAATAPRPEPVADAAATSALPAKAETAQVDAQVTEPLIVAEPAAVPEVLAAIPAPVPVAEPKAIATAAGKGEAHAAMAAHPAAAPLAPAPGAAPKATLAPAAPKRKK